MKKGRSKIAALLTSAAIVLTGCSSGGEGAEIDTQSGTEEAVTVVSEEETVPEETAVFSEDTTSYDNTEDIEESEPKTEAESTDITTAAQTGADVPQTENGGAQTENEPPRTENTPRSSSAETHKPQDTSSTDNTGESFSTVWSPANTWEENGSHCGTCELTVTNNGGSAVSGWTAKITVPDGFKITNSWNGNYTVSGTALTVTNVDYNKDIAAGAKISFGFNYSSPTVFNPPDSVNINGTAASAGSGNNGNNGGNGGNGENGNNGGGAVTPLPEPAQAGLVKEHGKLSVKGTRLVDKNGNNFQLKGMSTHGLAWFPGFVNENAFKTLRDDWNTNVIRLAMYSGENGGYCTGGNKEELKALIDKGVQAATKLGMYVIIDWHVLGDQNPQTYKSEAKAFFEEMSKKYGNYDNVLYEICNEPNGGASWEGDIKPYAEEVIPIIRKNSPDSVIIVGTPTWSQDIDKAAKSPLKEKNVLYALHFYAATHTDWLRQRLTECYNKGLPVFVTEFGTCDASGNGANDFNQCKKWLTLLDNYGISYCNWNLANKNESSSAFKESASANGNWSGGDYSEGGAWIRKWFRGEIK